MRLPRRRTPGAHTRRFVESHRERWQGARALYSEGARTSLVRLDDRIETTKRGLSATCVLLPTPGLASAPPRWPIFLAWQASSFTMNKWRNIYVPMILWFDPFLIDSTLQFVERLNLAEGGVDHSRRAEEFARNLARQSAE